MMLHYHFHSSVPVLKVLPTPCMLNHASNPQNSLCSACNPALRRQRILLLAPAKAEVNWSWGVSQKLCFCFYALWIPAVTLRLNPITLMVGERTDTDITPDRPRAQPSNCVVLLALALVVTHKDSLNTKTAPGVAGSPRAKSHPMCVSPAEWQRSASS